MTKTLNEIRNELKDEPKALLLLETLLQAYEDYGCKQNFNIGDKEIVSKTKLSTKTVVSKRQLLVDRGYIIYEKGKWGGKNSKGRNSTYQLTFLDDYVNTALEDNNGITKESTKESTKEITNNGSVLSNNSLIDIQTMNTEDYFLNKEKYKKSEYIDKVILNNPKDNINKKSEYLKEIHVNPKNVNPKESLTEEIKKTLEVDKRIAKLFSWESCLKLANQMKNEVEALTEDEEVRKKVFQWLRPLFLEKREKIEKSSVWINPNLEGKVNELTEKLIDFYLPRAENWKQLENRMSAAMLGVSSIEYNYDLSGLTDNEINEIKDLVRKNIKDSTNERIEMMKEAEENVVTEDVPLTEEEFERLKILYNETSPTTREQLENANSDGVAALYSDLLTYQVERFITNEREKNNFRRYCTCLWKTMHTSDSLSYG